MIPTKTLALALLTLLQTASSLIVLPPGLPDGHYSGDGTIDPATGFAKFKFTPFTPDEVDAIFNLTASTSASSATLARRDTVNCNGRGAGDAVTVVLNGFASYWDNRKFSGRWARTTAGSSQAYACNYGGEQTIHAGDFNSNMGSVTSVCGSGNAGWFEHPNWKLNYGRDHINSGIC